MSPTRDLNVGGTGGDVQNLWDTPSTSEILAPSWRGVAHVNNVGTNETQLLSIRNIDGGRGSSLNPFGTIS